MDGSQAGTELTELVKGGHTLAHHTTTTTIIINLLLLSTFIQRKVAQCCKCAKSIYVSK